MQKDVLWSLENMQDMISTAAEQGRIDGSHESHLKTVVKELSDKYRK